MRDIVNGKVDFEDVLVIISRTDFIPTNDDHWQSLWLGYTTLGGISWPEWRGYEDKKNLFKETCVRLYEQGRLHQPRQFGKSAITFRVGHHWLETVLHSEAHTSDPRVKRAWDQYQLIAGLTKNNLHVEDDF